MTDIEPSGTVTYICEPCGEELICYDQFRADEYEKAHKGSLGHARNELKLAVMKLGESLAPILEKLNAVAETCFAPPLNTPHDPSIRKDKRKWGGK